MEEEKLLEISDECIACGNCMELCPDVFQLPEGAEKSTVILPEGGPDCVDEAIEECPVGAIGWV
jgi:ferredoxin